MNLEQMTDEGIAKLAQVEEKKDRYFSELYKRHYEGLRNFAIGKGLDIYEAEDNAIISLEKAFNYIKSYKPHNKFSTWIYTIANNKIKDLYRKKNTGIRIPLNKIFHDDLLLESSIEDPDKFYEEDELQDKKDELKKAIEKLPKKYKVVVEKRIYEEKKFQEISRDLNLNENTCVARCMFFRAKDMIKKSINSKLL